MENYNEIINSYLKFFCCHLLESSGAENSGMCFESIYSYLKHYEKNISEVVYELHMQDICSKNVKEIVVFYNAAIDYLRHKLRKELQILDIQDRKKVFYVLTAFQAEFHGRVNLINDGVELDLNNVHPLERSILWLVKKQIHTYKIRGICAIDKNVIQLIFQECIEADQVQNGNKDSLIDTKSFCKIYGCALTIIELMGIRSFLQMRVFEAPVLQIKKGKLKFKGEVDYNTEQYVNRCETDMIQYDMLFPEYVKRLLDNNFCKSYGFKIDTVKNIASARPILLMNNNLATESNYATIIGEFVLVSKCSIEEAEKMFAYLCMDESKKNEKKYDSPEKDKNRIFEKCILKIDEDRYLYSQVLMGYAYRILERKLMFNMLEGCKGVNECIVRKKIKEKFVEKIEQYIKQYNIKTLSNVYKLDNGNVLSNEVDVIYIQRKVLYVVECKDVSFRFTPTGFMADMLKEREFIQKLRKKIESVKHNIKYFEEVLGQTIEMIEGCLVYRTANFVTETMKSDKGIDILSAEQFKTRFIKVEKEQ
jgi:hypothetical protein